MFRSLNKKDFGTVEPQDDVDTGFDLLLRMALRVDNTGDERETGTNLLLCLGKRKRKRKEMALRIDKAGDEMETGTDLLLCLGKKKRKGKQRS